MESGISKPDEVDEKKCVYNKDKNNLSLLEKSVADQIYWEKKVLKTDLIDVYKINPDSNKAKNSVSRSSYVGNGTNSLWMNQR